MGNALETNKYDSNLYRRFTTPAELHKAVNTLRGLVAGITTDSSVSDDEMAELVNWCVLHENLENRHPFNELLPIIRNACKDNIITSEESKDILWFCNNFVSDSDYYDLTTSSLQFLFGLIHGVMADGVLTDEEIHHLQFWIKTNSFLQGVYPFDEIESLLCSILLDEKITEEERGILTAFISEFIDTKMSYNLNGNILNSLKEKYSISGICSMCSEFEFIGKVFCFTGKSHNATRAQIANIVEERGGSFSPSVNKKVDYLIVGNAGNPCWAYSCYGRKIEEAVQLRKNGGKIIIMNEIDFWDNI